MKSVKHIADGLVLANTLMFVHIRKRRRGIATDQAKACHPRESSNPAVGTRRSGEFKGGCRRKSVVAFWMLAFASIDACLSSTALFGCSAVSSHSARATQISSSSLRGEATAQSDPQPSGRHRESELFAHAVSRADPFNLEVLVKHRK
jgi:hypothetical protein